MFLLWNANIDYSIFSDVFWSLAIIRNSFQALHRILIHGFLLLEAMQVKKSVFYATKVALDIMHKFLFLNIFSC